MSRLEPWGVEACEEDVEMGLPTATAELVIILVPCQLEGLTEVTFPGDYAQNSESPSAVGSQGPRRRGRRARSGTARLRRPSVGKRRLSVYRGNSLLLGQLSVTGT